VADIDIVEASRRSGLPASTLRFYEERGLIASTGRRGLRRTFDPQVVEQLALITLGQASGFSLDEIAQMFGADGRPNIDRARLAAKADELDLAIHRLTVHAARCKAPTHMECPTFRRILGLAGAGRLAVPRSAARKGR
jgi:DNA-binding transcriptional MerR regulator